MLVAPSMNEWMNKEGGDRQREVIIMLSRVDSLQPHGLWLPGSSIHGILQARVPEGVAISFSRGSSQPRNRTQVSCIAGRCITLWATREALIKMPDKVK